MILKRNFAGQPTFQESHMRTLPCILLIVACALQPPVRSPAQLLQRQSLLQAARVYPFRTWTDDSGEHQTVAKYLRHDTADVTLMKKNKLVLVVPFSRLSTTDRQYLDSLDSLDSLDKARRWPESSSLQSPRAAAPEQGAINTLNDFRLEVIDTISEDQSGQSETASRTSESAPSNSTSPSLSSVPLVDIDSEHQYRFANQALLEPLSRKEVYTVRQNLEKLLHGWPKTPTDDLVWAVAICAESGYFTVDEKGLLLLSMTDPQRHVAIFERSTCRPEFNLRKIAYEALAVINNERARGILLRKFDSGDDVFIAKLLPVFGNGIEESLHSHLKVTRPEHAITTCEVLSEIGTAKSIDLLTELGRHAEQEPLRREVNAALKKIQDRLPQPTSE